MKRSIVVLMLVAVLGFVATANADTNVWFSAPGSVSEGMGQTLILPGPGTYTVTMKADTDQLNGYSQDLYEGDGAANNITGWTPLVGWMIVDEPGLGGSPVIFDGGGEALLFGDPIFGANDLMSFELEYDGTPIFAGIGFNLYAPLQDIYFGPNGAVAANDQTMQPLAVIDIPEPATLALLGFGALALIRRRR